MNTEKHKFKRMKRWQYLVVSVCLNCGYHRLGTKGYYEYFKTWDDVRTTSEPECKPLKP